MNTKGKRVKFWTRITREKSQEWVLSEGWDTSGTPLAAWKSLNKLFWEWKSSGWFFPLDELEAYAIAVREMVRAAKRPCGLTRASRTTYLVTAATRALLKHRERVVEPARHTYRALTNGVRVPVEETETSAHGEDLADREWADVRATTPDVRAFVEAIPGLHSADGVHTARLAAETVRETLAQLDADAQKGLLAWLAADGVWIDAARLYNPRGSVQGYVYRFKKRWSPAFRKACTWAW